MGWWSFARLPERALAARTLRKISATPKNYCLMPKNALSM
jgi:hypothetical protein